MSDEKCCCNCLHCARWKTKDGVQCHCDLTDRYLSYLDVMDTDNDCSRWEKETKWDEQEKHDKEVYNKAICDVLKEIDDLDFEGGTRETLAVANAVKNYVRKQVEVLKYGDGASVDSVLQGCSHE